MKNENFVYLFVVIIALVVGVSQTGMLNFSVIATPNPQAGINTIVSWNPVIDANALQPAFRYEKTPVNSVLTVINVPENADLIGDTSYVYYNCGSLYSLKTSVLEDKDPNNAYLNTRFYGSDGFTAGGYDNSKCGISYHLEYSVSESVIEEPPVIITEPVIPESDNTDVQPPVIINEPSENPYDLVIFGLSAIGVAVAYVYLTKKR